MLINAVGADSQLFSQVDELFILWMTHNGHNLLRAQFAARRYKFIVTRFDVDARSVDLAVEVEPRGRGQVVTSEYGRKSLVREAPAHALPASHYLDAVTSDRSLVYRGIAWEEWAAIRKTGFVQSFGNYNIGQADLTLWGDDFSTAAYYANGFAPWPFKPGFETPGVVIAASRSLTIGPHDHKEVPDGERATVGPLPASALAAAWALIPIEVEFGSIKGEIFTRAKNPKFEEHQVYNPSAHVVVVPNRG